MNINLKKFLHRGLIFGGFGPIVCGIVFLFISLTSAELSLNGKEVFLAIISTYILAFVHAGATVFNQIEEWSVPKSLLAHFSSLYIVYVLCYILNSWIPFDPKVILVFTGIFVSLYFFIWTTVYICVKAASKKLNSKLK